MKRFLAILLTFHMVLLNGSIGRAQVQENYPKSHETLNIQELFQNLEKVKANIRFLDYQRQVISPDVAILNLADGQRIYITSAVANSTELRIQKVPELTNGNFSVSLLVEQFIGPNIADTTRFDLNIESEAVPYIYRKLFGEPAAEQRSSTELRRAEVGEYYHKGQDFTLNCHSAVEAVTGKRVKVVGLHIGPGGVGNLFVILLPVGLLFLLKGRPTKARLAVAALFPLFFFSLAISLKYVSHHTGCGGEIQ